MPECPHCQTPYDKGQRYCSVCGSFLLHPEEGDNFCPQCGVRVSPRQEFCHECDAPLKAEGLHEIKVAPGEAPAAVPTVEAGPAPAAQGMPSWLKGSLAVGGIIVVFILILLYSRPSEPPAPPAAPPAAPPKAEAPAPPAPTPGPAPSAEAPTPEAALQEQLQGVLSTLRESQLKKDISVFMSVYSSSLPNYDQKRKDILESWEKFDYTNLVFTVDKVQAIDADNALAWVTWYMDIRNRNTQELSTTTQAYQVRFVKDKGNWRIREIKEVQ